MRDVLLLRLDAHLLSFGAPMVDRFGVVQPFPSLAQMTGMLANALGCDHTDFRELERLQERLRYAVRQDIRGEKLRDFHTVDLGQPHLVDTGWTTRGKRSDRKGASNESTHIRERDYYADSAYTVAVALENDVAGEPGIDELAKALAMPARPLFIGRKCCIPSRPIFSPRDRVTASCLVDALRSATRHPRERHSARRSPATELTTVTREAWWADDPGEPEQGDLPLDPGLPDVFPVTDERDFRNQIHVGRRFIRHGLIRLAEVAA